MDLEPNNALATSSVQVAEDNRKRSEVVQQKHPHEKRLPSVQEKHEDGDDEDDGNDSLAILFQPSAADAAQVEKAQQALPEAKVRAEVVEMGLSWPTEDSLCLARLAQCLAKPHFLQLPDKSMRSGLQGDPLLVWCLQVLVKASGSLLAEWTGAEAVAAQAMSLLAESRVSFSQLSLRGIRVPSARLRGAVLDHTDLTGADLRGVQLEAVCLRNAVLDGCLADGLRFGELPVLEGHEGAITRLAASSDGQLLASMPEWDAFDDGILLWDLDSCKRQASIRPRYWCTDLAWVPRSSELLVSYRDGALIRYDGRTGAAIEETQLSLDGIGAFAICPTRPQLLLALGRRSERLRDDNITISVMLLIDCSTGESRELHHWKQDMARFTEDAEVYFSCSGDRAAALVGEQVLLLDVRSVCQARTLRDVKSSDMNPSDSFSSLAFTGDGQFLVVSASCCVYLFSAQSGQPVGYKGVNATSGMRTLMPVPRTAAFAFISSAASEVEVQRYDESQREFQLDDRILVSGQIVHQVLAEGSSGEVLVCVGCTDGLIHLYTLQSSKGASPELPSDHQHHRGQVTGLLLLDDGLLLSAGSDGLLQVWSPSGDSLAAGGLGRPHSLDINCLAAAPDGRCFASGGADGVVRVFWLDGQKLVRNREFSAGEHEVNAILFGQGGQTLLAAGFDGIIREWDLTAEPIVCLRHSGGQTDELTSHSINALAISPKGTILSGDDSGNLHEWTAEGESISLLRTVGVSNLPLSCLGVSPDGKLLAVGGFDNDIQVYDCSSPDQPVPQETLQGHFGEVSKVRFSADGRWLFSSSHDGAVYVWHITSQRMHLWQIIVSDGSGVIDFVLQPDGLRMVTAHWNGSIQSWTLHPDQQVARMEWMANRACLSGANLRYAAAEGLSNRNQVLLKQLCADDSGLGTWREMYTAPRRPPAERGTEDMQLENMLRLSAWMVEREKQHRLSGIDSWLLRRPEVLHCSWIWRFTAPDRMSRLFERRLERTRAPETDLLPLPRTERMFDGKDTNWNLATRIHSHSVQSCRLALHYGAQVHVQTRENPSSALLAAAERGDARSMRYMLAHGRGYGREDLTRPFIAAASAGQLAVLRLLHSKGADLHCRVNDCPVVYIAAFGGSLDVLLWLEQNGVDIAWCQAQGMRYCLAETAAAGGHLTLVRFYLDRGVDINVQDETGNTPLVSALLYGHAVLGRWLLRAGADYSLRNAKGVNGLTAAVVGGCTEIVREMLAMHACRQVVNEPLPGRFGLTLLCLALEREQEEIALQLLDAEADAAVRSDAEFDKSALSFAITNDELRAVQAIHARQPQLLAEDAQIFAAWNGAIEQPAKLGRRATVAFLLTLIRDKTYLSPDEASFLDLAVRSGDDAAVAQLCVPPLVNHSSPKLYDYTPLLFAVSLRQANIAAVLLSHGADVAALEQTSHDTALTIAAQRGALHCVELLCEHGADVNEQEALGFTALIIASQFGHSAVVRCLLDHGADMEITTTNKHTTALQAAAGSGHVHVVRLLGEHGANLEAANSGDYPALHTAAQEGCVNVVSYMIEQWPRLLNSTTSQGTTALMVTVLANQPDTFLVLRKAGADLMLVDSEQRSIFAYLIHRACERVLNVVMLDEELRVMLTDAVKREVSRMQEVAVATQGVPSHATVVRTILTDCQSVCERLIESFPDDGDVQLCFIRLVVCMQHAGMLAEARALCLRHSKQDLLLPGHPCDVDAEVDRDTLLTLLLKSRTVGEEAISQLVAAGADVCKTHSRSGLAPIHVAAAQDPDSRKLAALLRCGAPTLVIDQLTVVSSTSFAQIPVSALFLAAQAGQPENMISLLNAGADPNLPLRDLRDDTVNTALICAVTISEADVDTRVKMVQTLTAHGARADVALLLQGATLLMYAIYRCARGDQWVELVEALLSAPGTDVLHTDPKGMDALGLALACPTEHSLCLLLPHYPPCVLKQRLSTRKKTLLLHFAALEGSDQACRIVLDLVDDVDATTASESSSTDEPSQRQSEPSSATSEESGSNRQGITALHRAALRGRSTIVQMLLERGANPNARCSDEEGGATPLHLATVAGRVDVVKLLVAKPQTDLNSRRADGSTALHLAIRLPVMRGADDDYFSVESEPTTIALVEVLSTAAGVEVDLPWGPQRFTALHLASQRQSVGIVRALLQARASLTCGDDTGWLPQHFAAQAGVCTMVQLMLDYGAPINATNGAGYTMLMIAASHNNAELLQLLLRHSGCDTNVHADEDGLTALHLAAHAGFTHIVEALMVAGADPEAASRPKQQTTLHFAVFGNRLQTVEWLLNRTNWTGEALIVRSSSQQLPAARGILSGEASDQREDEELQRAIAMSLVPQLPKADPTEGQSAHASTPLPPQPARVKLSARTWRGETALHLAASAHRGAGRSSLQIAELLLTSGLDPNDVTDAGFRAIDFAGMASREDMIQLLAAFGSEPPRNKDSLTPDEMRLLGFVPIMPKVFLRLPTDHVKDDQGEPADENTDEQPAPTNNAVTSGREQQQQPAAGHATPLAMDGKEAEYQELLLALAMSLVPQHRRREAGRAAGHDEKTDSDDETSDSEGELEHAVALSLLPPDSTD